MYTRNFHKVVCNNWNPIRPKFNIWWKNSSWCENDPWYEPVHRPRQLFRCISRWQMKSLKFNTACVVLLHFIDCTVWMSGDTFQQVFLSLLRRNYCQDCITGLRGRGRILARVWLGIYTDAFYTSWLPTYGRRLVICYNLQELFGNKVLGTLWQSFIGWVISLINYSQTNAEQVVQIMLWDWFKINKISNAELTRWERVNHLHHLIIVLNYLNYL